MIIGVDVGGTFTDVFFLDEALVRLTRSSLDHAWSGTLISIRFPLKFWRDFSPQGTADSGCTPYPNIPAIVCSNVSTNRLSRVRSPFYVKLRFPWGEELGAELRDMSAFQGHGSVAHPHGILITWALMMEGGIQVNLEGKLFSNEHQGYSEQSVSVFQQPEHLAWDFYDARFHQLGLEFEDYRNADQMGAIRSAHDLEKLSKITSLPKTNLERTFQDI